MSRVWNPSNSWVFVVISEIHVSVCRFDIKPCVESGG